MRENHENEANTFYFNGAGSKRKCAITSPQSNLGYHTCICHWVQRFFITWFEFESFEFTLFCKHASNMTSFYLCLRSAGFQGQCCGRSSSNFGSRSCASSPTAPCCTCLIPPLIQLSILDATLAGWSINSQVAWNRVPSIASSVTAYHFLSDWHHLDIPVASFTHLNSSPMNFSIDDSARRIMLVSIHGTPKQLSLGNIEFPGNIEFLCDNFTWDITRWHELVDCFGPILWLLMDLNALMPIR